MPWKGFRWGWGPGEPRDRAPANSETAPHRTSRSRPSEHATDAACRRAATRRWPSLRPSAVLDPSDGEKLAFASPRPLEGGVLRGAVSPMRARAGDPPRTMTQKILAGRADDPSLSGDLLRVKIDQVILSREPERALTEALLAGARKFAVEVAVAYDTRCVTRSGRGAELFSAACLSRRARSRPAGRSPRHRLSQPPFISSASEAPPVSP